MGFFIGEDMDWVLIITIVATGFRPAVSVEQVEMQGRESCLSAAKFYSRLVKAPGYIVKTTCVSKVGG